MAMSISITCPGCGHPLEVSSRDERKEVECVLCGAVCPVPAVPVKAAAGKRARSEAIRAPGRAPAPDDSPSRRKAVYYCLHCGKKSRLPVPVNGNGQPRICPYCGLSEVEPAIEDEPAPPVAPRQDTPRPCRAPHREDWDDGKPYPVADAGRRACPGCSQELAEDAKVCGSCGYNLRTGKRPKKSQEPLRRSWEAGLPLRRRARLAVAGVAAVWLVFGFAAATVPAFASAFLTPWLIFTLLLVLAVGSFPRIDLVRNPTGQVTLTKTWRVAFRTLAPTSYKVFDYEGVSTGMVRETDFWDWLPLVVLAPFGVVPAVWWWLRLMSQDMYFVALAKDHGYPDVILYRGWNRVLAQDLARALRDVGGW
jgi:hypothetical protein